MWNCEWWDMEWQSSLMITFKDKLSYIQPNFGLELDLIFPYISNLWLRLFPFTSSVLPWGLIGKGVPDKAPTLALVLDGGEGWLSVGEGDQDEAADDQLVTLPQLSVSNICPLYISLWLSRPNDGSDNSNKGYSLNSILIYSAQLQGQF